MARGPHAMAQGHGWFFWHVLGVVLFATVHESHSQGQGQSQSQSQCHDINGNETDSGGDPCSYYDSNPQHCGCCDTTTFRAQGCCACQGPPVSGDASWWAYVYFTWPGKATALRLSGKDIASILPADVAERWPHLTEIDLSGNQLTGGLPPGLANLPNLSHLNLRDNWLSGSLPPELGNMTFLQTLDLQNNWLEGSLPPELGKMTFLQTLDLGDNWLEGSLPPELGKMTFLQTLDLQNNWLEGSLPPELGNMTFLQTLNLGNNWLEGSLPPELGNMQSLRVLDLHYNWPFTGGLPRELGRLTNLQHLHLHSNRFSGGIPAELGNIAGLQTLYLYNNALSGTLPAELGKLGNLQYLYLYGNQLSGGLPAELGNLTSLRQLFLHNNALNGSIPVELGNLASLQRLALASTQLSGTIPAELGKLTSLTHLWLFKNELNGSLPAELSQLTNLQRLSLNNNRLSGGLPAEFGKMVSLRFLYLWTNELSGSVPRQLGNLTGLEELLLHDNRFSGSIPPELGNLTGLWELELSSNRLSGSVPQQFGNLVRLTRLSLRNNEFSGSLPAGFWNLTSLSKLYLDGNQFSGTLARGVGNLRSLQELRLGDNKLNGPLPAELGNLTSLIKLKMPRNLFIGSLPPELGNLGSSLSELELEGNQLSGSLPPELGKLRGLQTLRLNNNRLSGSLPPEFGNLTSLRTLSLEDNELGGTLPPELGGLQMLQVLSLKGNQLRGGLHPSFRGLLSLQTFQVEGNALFCGGTEVVVHWVRLLRLELRGCCFQNFSALPASLEFLDLGDNLLTEVPRAWRETSPTNVSLKTLRLDGNRIGQWDTSTIVPLQQFQGGAWKCGYMPVGQRFPWLQLESLDVSRNPLDMTIYDFLASLSHLDKLTVLRAQDAGLRGALPKFADPFVPNVLSTGQIDCTGFTKFYGFLSLLSLDLAGNSLTAIDATPSQGLVQVDLSRNKLTSLNSLWRQGGPAGLLQRVDVTGNPGLRLPVLLDASGRTCPLSGVMDPTANNQGWNVRLNDSAVECTGLCAMTLTRFLVDATLNESVLCRCTEGQGAGADCSPCPEDTFSALSFGNGQYSRSCRACPANSHLRDFQGGCFADCSCSTGYYMVQISNGSAQDVGTTPCSRLAPEGECLSCGIFKTSRQGSRKESDCFCNGDRARGGWEGLLERQGRCGCKDGFHMNFAERTCVPCQNQEDCMDWTRSLEPPSVNRGFWASPVPPRGSDGLFGNFSGHSIWRCQSTFACPGNSSCGGDLTGTACSLCRQGYFRDPSGGCTPCSQTPGETRLLLVLGLLSCVVFPILVHRQLRAEMRERKGPGSVLRPIRTSVKQILKFTQILGLISLFGVEWPPIAEPVFTGARAFSLDFAGWLGVACLDAQQQESMPLVIGFRWVLPLAGVVVTCLAALLVTISGCVLGPLSGRCCKEREENIRQRLRFKPPDVLRVLVFFLNLFFPSLLKNGLLPLTCTPSPNGLLTMNAFPHQVCWEKGDGFWTVASLGMTQTVLLSVGFPLLLYFAWKRIDSSWSEEVQKQRQRWWAFVFADFRPHKIFWLLVAVSKDILLNLIVVILPGLGTAQLLITAVISIVYACAAFCISPYPELSNSLMETCTATAVAVLCLFTAGVGFQSETEMPSLEASIAGGRDSAGYAQRTIGLVSLQGLSMVCPAAIVAYQLLAAFDKSRLLLPECIRPMSDEQREEWAEDFSKTMCLEGSPLPRTLSQLDRVDFRTFKRATVAGRLERRSRAIRSTISGDEAQLREQNAALVEENNALKAQVTDLQVALYGGESPATEPNKPTRMQSGWGRHVAEPVPTSCVHV